MWHILKHHAWAAGSVAKHHSLQRQDVRVTERGHDVHFSHKVFLGFARRGILQHLHGDDLLRVSVMPFTCNVSIGRDLTSHRTASGIERLYDSIGTFVNLAEASFANVIQENERVPLYDRDFRRSAREVLRVRCVFIR